MLTLWRIVSLISDTASSQHTFCITLFTDMTIEWSTHPPSALFASVQLTKLSGKRTGWYSV